ncbi:MAG: phosphoribosylformylglycinamidine synthase I [Planctomycetaceae bacterium]
MAKPRVCVLRAPGTNCDIETAFAFEMAGAQAERVHLFELLKRPQRLTDYQMLCVPGGFSYGDDVGAGVIFARQLRVQLRETLGQFLENDTLALGICNGFQVLLKAGVLPGGADGWQQTDRPPQATLTWNDNGKYTALWVRLRIHAPQNAFLRDIDEIELPVAHAEGRICVTDDQVTADWTEQGQVALKYTAPASEVAVAADGLLPFPFNPNGSIANIAGLSDRSGRILGLMPHPERYIQQTQHPRWTRDEQPPEHSGRRLFENAVQYFA